MNRDRIEGNWTQLKGNVKQQWGKLTDYQMDLVADKRGLPAGKIKDLYSPPQGRGGEIAFPTGKSYEGYDPAQI